MRIRHCWYRFFSPSDDGSLAGGSGEEGGDDGFSADLALTGRRAGRAGRARGGADSGENKEDEREDKVEVVTGRRNEDADGERDEMNAGGRRAGEGIHLAVGRASYWETRRGWVISRRWDSG